MIAPVVKVTEAQQETFLEDADELRNDHLSVSVHESVKDAAGVLVDRILGREHE